MPFVPEFPGQNRWLLITERAKCEPASVWVKASRLHPLIPRNSERYKAFYHQRGAVERVFGRLKNEWAMTPLRVRRLERVRLHVDVTILTHLASVLARIT